jgi:hypothetical protein
VERNIKVFRAHRALSLLYFLLIALLSAVLFGSTEARRDPLFLLLLFLFIGIFLAHYLTARGAKQAKPWARVSSIVISVFLLIGFPLGTLIAIYLLVNTWQPWPSNVAAPSTGA